MAVHMSPDEIAALLEVEPDVVINAAHEVDVPVYQGQIDRVLFVEALEAADHHLAGRAAERLLRDGEAGSG
jgi:hypothetical protein